MIRPLEDLFFQTIGNNAFDVILYAGNRELPPISLAVTTTPQTLSELILASASPAYAKYASADRLLVIGIDDSFLSDSPIYFTRSADAATADLTLQGNILEVGMELGSGKEWDVQVIIDSSVTTHGTTQTWKKVITNSYDKRYYLHLYNTSAEDVDLGWFELSETVEGSTEAIYIAETLPARSSIYIQMKAGYFLASKATLLSQTLNRRLFKRVRL